jgi:catechol 2,3-dioxygenase-like lactoylglutathione lyase family enzyme
MQQQGPTGQREGAPPARGFAAMVAELLVSDIESSLAFWCGPLGFAIAYQRPEQRFAYLERPEGAQVMLAQRSGKWETGPLEPPFGRGVMFQLFGLPLAPIETALEQAGIPLHTGPREVWRRYGDREGGRREIVVLDPDGYLVMLTQELGERALTGMV